MQVVKGRHLARKRLNWWKVLRAWGSRQSWYPVSKEGLGCNRSSMWSSIVLLKHNVVSLNSRNHKESLCLDTSFLSCTMPPYRMAPHTITHPPPYESCSASYKPFSTKAMNMNPTVMEIKDEPRFVAPHNWSPLFKKSVEMVATPLFSKCLVLAVKGILTTDRYERMPASATRR